MYIHVYIIPYPKYAYVCMRIYVIMERDRDMTKYLYMMSVINMKICI